ncbi:T9SS type A sorting domain-containing protein [Hymenobacter sp. 15J16-1T3B]|uniref:LamG-like jellyroll fold domain-containing protein n=1 Tax=Hymenobacter sp. 15J16-1T3B TaxID=2886941 RepID=UPI001D10E252|nr:LamG-like jellyroll fold domain-containing protein [Hymenobacter sp. 15J16-1T3B]MCC3159550.1 T9SS type A sorting domain-containing protein [Hymenobacter sp. 15J16-1T3B]
MKHLIRKAGLLALLGTALSSSAYAQRGGNFLGFTSAEDDKVTVTNFALPATGSFSLEAWVYFNGTAFGNNGSYNTVLEFGNDDPWFGVNGSGQVSLYQAVAGGTVPVRTWAHIAYTWDGTTGTVYLDGTPVGTSTSAPARGGSGLGIGYNSGDSGWQGYIDEVMVWGAARTQAQIQSDRTSGPPAGAAFLLAYFKFEDAATGQTVANLANGAFNGVRGSTAATEPNDPIFTNVLVNSARSASVAAGQLQPNYPNPVAGQTTIPFVLQRPGHVRLSVLDLAGREVATLLDETRPAGAYAAPFRPGRLAAGVYLTQLSIDGQRLTRRLVVQ